MKKLPFQQVDSKTWIGMGLILLSAFIFSIMTLLVQEAGTRGIPSYEMITIRCIIQSAYSLFCSLWIDINPFGTKGNRVIPILRGLFGSISAGALYYGATHIPIADSTVLVFSTPIWTPFVAKIVTKEPFRLINFVAIGIGFVGVIFIAQPSVIFPHSDNSSNENTAAPGSLLYLIAAAFCVFGAILNSICFVLIRKSRGKVHFQVFVFYYGIIGIFTGFISLLIVQGLPVNPDSITTWIYLILISICGCIGQTTVSKGAQLISPLKTSVIRNIDIAFVLLWQVIFIHQIPTIWSMIGVVLICGCCILIAIVKPKPQPKPSTEEESNNEIINNITSEIEIEMENKTTPQKEEGIKM